MKHLPHLFVEALREIRAHGSQSVIGICIIAAMVVAVAVTYGRAVSTAEEAIASIDTAAARTITVRFGPNADVTVADTEPFSRVTTVHDLTVLGPARDTHNSFVPGDEVTLRDCYSSERSSLCPTPRTAPPYPARATEPTMRVLGFSDDVGAVTDAHRTLTLTATTHDHMTMPESALTQTVVTPALPHSDAPEPEAQEADDSVSLMLVTASSPGAVADLVDMITKSFGHLDPGDLVVDHHLDLIELRDQLDDTLLAGTRAQALGALAVAGTMLALAEFSAARSRRRFAGLQRALGASRIQIVIIAVCRSVIVGCLGALTGVAASVGITAIWFDATPPWRFLAALAITAELVVVIASVAPAWYSATRDPMAELRVP